MAQRKFRDEPCHACGTPQAVISGAWLRERRSAAGLTLREMARRLDFTAVYLSYIERNRRACTPTIRAAYEALTWSRDIDDGAYLRKRCYACGHRLRFAATGCPQCGEQFDGRSDPRRWPETCDCERCAEARK